MRNKRINLFLGKKDYQEIQKYFRIFRLSLIGISLLLSIFVLVIGYFIYLQKQTISKKTTLKRNSLQLFNSQKEEEVKLIKIANKTKDFENFIKDDAEFYPYYNKLVAVFNESEEVPAIESLSIKKDKNFSFSISFTTKEGLIKTFKLVESEEFLKNFDDLYLSDLDVQKNEKGENYKMTFDGKFSKINENKN